MEVRFCLSKLKHGFKKILFFCILFLQGLGCSKDNIPVKKNTPEPTHPITHAKIISYYNFEPDTVFKYPPNEGVLQNQLDINHDSIADINIYREVSYMWYPPNNNWWFSKKRIEALNGNFLIVASTHNCIEYSLVSPCSSALDSLDNIGIESKKIKIYYIMYSEYMDSPCNCSFSEKKYLGIVLHKSNNDYYGWIGLNSDITLFDCAINSIPDDSIKAGEK